MAHRRARAGFRRRPNRPAPPAPAPDWRAARRRRAPGADPGETRAAASGWRACKAARPVCRQAGVGARHGVQAGSNSQLSAGAPCSAIASRRSILGCAPGRARASAVCSAYSARPWRAASAWMPPNCWCRRDTPPASRPGRACSPAGPHWRRWRRAGSARPGGSPRAGWRARHGIGEQAGRSSGQSLSNKRNKAVL